MTQRDVNVPKESVLVLVCRGRKGLKVFREIKEFKETREFRETKEFREFPAWMVQLVRMVHLGQQDKPVHLGCQDKLVHLGQLVQWGQPDWRASKVQSGLQDLQGLQDLI